MADIFLTQSEGDALLAMGKIASSKELDMPVMGGKLHILLQSEDKKEEFILNYT